MFAVFAGFVLPGDATIKPIASALAPGIVFDAVVRMIIMPSAPALLGAKAWWLPRWLNWLPTWTSKASPWNARPRSASGNRPPGERGALTRGPFVTGVTVDVAEHGGAHGPHHACLKPLPLGVFTVGAGCRLKS
jgi:hypothetical protein